MDIIKVSEKLTGKKVNYSICPRRAGDPAVLVADNKKAREILGWIPKYDLTKIIETAWLWQKNRKF
jgi:UDP-glucose 4-epimerase